ncbi:helix-turn-helix domain-containing protein [Paenibacillus popilliae]|uniref:Uncharacterized protein conserved in bacteria n=1 Tax=Paenibacillus popilliae ATCC 14706 TaxID=1212764 RepID=M9M576_PAEPP|nr:uncharacterized protein conserved in bacteria [Paenibacillus popilliae ATCC 14706]
MYYMYMLNKKAAVILGTKLKQIRVKIDLTQQEVATRLGIKLRMYQHIEKVQDARHTKSCANSKICLE